MKQKLITLQGEIFKVHIYNLNFGLQTSIIDKKNVNDYKRARERLVMVMTMFIILMVAIYHYPVPYKCANTYTIVCLGYILFMSVVPQ